MDSPFVAVLMGSDTDLPVLEVTIKTLNALGVLVEARILSAHRMPTALADYVLDADKRGCAVFIAAAGLAAHLAGAVAAHTLKPVIGVPMDAGTLGGIDALLATVQMPSGTPVACTAIGAAGAKNAAILAGQILALSNPSITVGLAALRQEKRTALDIADQSLREKITNAA